MTYQEAVNAMVHPGCQIIRRLPQLILTYPDSFWVDDQHKSRIRLSSSVDLRVFCLLRPLPAPK